ncbi:hypothetical protein LTR37_001123 [Vermiconidia calcicola]|uniref:Uncharacterized protein n=1 Tax=Vermiconidia calcicola TaxID=1690605 RepID=A0ACC3NX48_9PEZI|nr:hypothetical protein LTR37_001123 [Vermiconidia calcicola]
MLHSSCVVLLLLIPCTVSQVLSSSKRGLIYIYNSDNTDDDHIWDAASSDLTWYYNYSPYRTDGLDHSTLDFVPMLWGEPNTGDQGFYDAVESQINSGMDITHVLGFNEPDGCEGGGSCVDAKTAARLWLDEIEPLKKHGVKLGAPAVRGFSEGVKWYNDFLSHCDGRCTIDFLPLHFYGDFAGLAGYVGGMSAAYEGMPIWVTEFAHPDTSLEETHAFYNQSSAFLDETSYIKRYSWFGSFRSDVANDYVGPNVAMLEPDGELTDIGAWYLGHPAEWEPPKSEAAFSSGLFRWIAMVATAVFLTWP